MLPSITILNLFCAFMIMLTGVAGSLAATFWILEFRKTRNGIVFWGHILLGGLVGCVVVVALAWCLGVFE